MLCKLPKPKEIPAFAELLRDIGDANPKTIAKALGVSERTARRWIATGDAPLVARVALFSASSWGRQWVDVDLFNEFTLANACNRALQQELGRTKAALEEEKGMVAKLGRLGDFGSANDPTDGVEGPGPSKELALTFATFEEQQAMSQAGQRAPAFVRRNGQPWARRSQAAKTA